MGRIWLVPLLFLFWACGVRTADACTCATRSASCGPPADYWRANAVFIGRVAAIERTSPRVGEQRVRIRVTHRFRGTFDSPGDEVALVTPFACRYPFKTGQEYFIYADRQSDGTLSTTSCSRTRPLERAEAELVYARAVASGSASRGRIVGEVRYASGHDPKRLPVANIAVTLSRDGSTIATATDAHGRYMFEPTVAGSYVLDVALPESMYVLQPRRTVDVPDPRACVESNVEVFFDGHVYGRIVDAAGHAVAGLTVAHMRADPAARHRSESRRTLTNDDGTFRIVKVPPGPFVVAVELPVDGDGIENAAGPDASSITLRGVLGRGERRRLDPLRLPSVVRVGRLEGMVNAADGNPAVGARVFLKTATDNGHIVGEPAIADSLGRFLIAVLEDERYQVFAERQILEAEATRSEFSDPIAFVAASEMPPLRLTVRRRF